MTTMLMVREAATQYRPRSETAVPVPVPPAFDWLEHFEPDEQAAFYAELLEATAFCQQVQRWDRLTSLLESWQSRAKRRAQPELQRRMAEAQAKLPAAQADRWPELRDHLEVLYYLENQLRDFEARYGMSSEELVRRLEADELEEEPHFLEWAGIYRWWQKRRASHEILLTALETSSEPSAVQPS
jgi:hypothetical protein